MSTKRRLFREQVKVFLISYFTNMLSLLGLSFYFVTSTFYDDSYLGPDDWKEGQITLPEV